MTSYVHIDNKNKDILILGKGPIKRLENTTLTEEAEFSINFSRSQRKFCLSLHYNGSNSFLFVNATKLYQFKAKNSEIAPYLLCLRKMSMDFTANKMKKRQDYMDMSTSVDYNIIDTRNIFNIHKYLMKKHVIK